MMMRAAQCLARFGHRDFHQPQRDRLRAFFAGDDFKRFAAGEPELFGIRLRQHARHQPATFRCLISAVPPWAWSSMLNMSVASFAIASAISLSIFTPLATVACCGEPYQPVSAMVRMSVSTGW